LKHTLASAIVCFNISLVQNSVTVEGSSENKPLAFRLTPPLPVICNLCKNTRYALISVGKYRSECSPCSSCPWLPKDMHKLLAKGMREIWALGACMVVSGQHKNITYL